MKILSRIKSLFRNNNKENSGFNITKKEIHDGLFGFLKLVNTSEMNDNFLKIIYNASINLMNLFNVYPLYEITPSHGSMCYVYDKEDKKYQQTNFKCTDGAMAIYTFLIVYKKGPSRKGPFLL